MRLLMLVEQCHKLEKNIDSWLESQTNGTSGWCKWRFPEIGGTPKSSIFTGVSIINHAFYGNSPLIWVTYHISLT